MFFDSHAHLTGSETFADLSAVLERARFAGVHNIMNICTDLPSLQKGLELSEQHNWIYQSAAITPHDIDKMDKNVFDIMADRARNKKLKAIGETGLDYHYDYSLPAAQKKMLSRFLQLALECELPIIIHCREAFKDLFEIIDCEYRLNGGYAPGILHCFTGTIKEAEQVLERGWMLSLSGIVTFKKSVQLQAVAHMTPLNQLLIETDAPYLAPEGYRGKRNEPAFVIKTAQCIAQIKQCSIQEIATSSAQNAKTIFKL